MSVRRGPTAALAVLLCQALAAAAAPPDVPAEVPYTPGWPEVLVVKGTGEFGVQPAFKTGPGAAAFFEELAPSPGARRFLFLAKADREFPVVFWGKGETSGKTVVFRPGGTAPPDADPVPADPLYRPLAEAFGKDDPATRKADSRALAAVYRLAAKDGGAADNPALKTAADLFKVMSAAGAAVVPPGRLPNTREALAAELDRTLGKSAPAALDDAYRLKAKAQFSRAGLLLEYLAK